MNLNYEISGEPSLSPNALVVLNKRYLKKDDEGTVIDNAVDLRLGPGYNRT